MHSLRKWIFKPKKSDESLLAQFYYADEDLNTIAAELDSFDGRKEPERCTVLINKLRNCQDKVLGIVEKVMVDAIPERRAPRDFRVKFPDDVLQDNLAGQLWFGAECLAAGSSIMNREVESASMRPLARSLTRLLDQLRSLLREHCLRNTVVYTEDVKKALEQFDKLFAEFELSYVSAMVPVKSMRDYDILQEVMVLFSETVQRAFKESLITQDMIDYYDPALMFTIPRLAIVCGLFVYPEGPLNPDMDPGKMSEMFRPFQTLLYKIRELLSTLTEEELKLLEKCLCSNEEPAHLTKGQPQLLHNEQSNGTTTLKLLADSVLKNESVSSDVFNDSIVNKEVQIASIALSSESSDLSTPTLIQEEGNKVGITSEDDESSDCDLSCDTDSSLRGSSENLSTTSDSEEEDEDSSYSGLQRAKRKVRKSHGLGVRRKVPHQESKDSGMPSEPDPSHFETHTVESHRLRHSKSWPDTLHNNNHDRSKKSNHSKSPSLYECRDSKFGATGGGPSLELIASSNSDSEENNYLNRSAQEFIFNIPKDTSLDYQHNHHYPVMEPENASIHSHIPSILVQSSNEIDDNNLRSSPSHSDSHVAYITDTLNSIFVTDPEEAGEITCHHSSSSSYCENINDNHDCADVNTQSCQLCDKEPEESGENFEGEIPNENSDNICDKHCSHSSATEISSTCDKCDNCELSSDNKSCDCPSPLAQSVSEKCSRKSVPAITHSGSGESSSKDQCLTCLQQKQHHKKSKAISSIATLNSNQPSTSGTQEQDDRAKNTTTTHCNNESCPCKPGRGSKDNNNKIQWSDNTHLEVPVRERSHKVHYRRLKSTESSASRTVDKESISSSDTCSLASAEMHESESEISLAIQAAEVAARRDARARFKSSGELIHRLFVCISGVADQLQTNYAADLRHILKCVFECNASEPTPEEISSSSDKSSTDAFVHISSPESSNQSNDSGQNEIVEDLESEGVYESDTPSPSKEDPPKWIPDEESPTCTSCKAPFTFVRRRHHCRNCGRIFCGRCSSNSVPLPQFGQEKPVRVCNRCFMFHVTPFTSVDE